MIKDRNSSFMNEEFEQKEVLYDLRDSNNLYQPF